MVITLNYFWVFQLRDLGILMVYEIDLAGTFRHFLNEENELSSIIKHTK